MWMRLGRGTWNTVEWMRGTQAGGLQGEGGGFLACSGAAEKVEVWKSRLDLAETSIRCDV